MPIKDIPHQKLKGSGWNTRGYLPQFDGVAIPQFITLNLVDAIPLKVIDRWKKELQHLSSKEEQILMQRRIDAYLDQGYGSCYLKDPTIAAMVEESLLDRDGIDYKTFRLGLIRWGRPGTAALRQKSVCVLTDGDFCSLLFSVFPTACPLTTVLSTVA